jgi:hypothetical protein
MIAAMYPPIAVRPLRDVLRYIDILLNHELFVLLAIFADFVVGTSMDRVQPCARLIVARSSPKTAMDYFVDILHKANIGSNVARI